MNTARREAQRVVSTIRRRQAGGRVAARKKLMADLEERLPLAALPIVPSQEELDARVAAAISFFDERGIKSVKMRMAIIGFAERAAKADGDLAQDGWESRLDRGLAEWRRSSPSRRARAASYFDTGQWHFNPGKKRF